MALKSMLGAIGLALGLWAGAAAAQPACTTTGDASARAVGTNEPAQVLALLLAAGPALTPALLDTANLPPACVRGTLMVSGKAYKVSGENSDPIIRRASTGDAADPAVLLIPMAQAATPNAPRGYLLVFVDKTNASILVAVDKIPDDAVFARFANIALGVSPPRPLIQINRATGAPTLNVGPPAQAAQAAGGPRQLTGPDGVVFQAAENGGVRHVLTGIVCPGSLAGKPVTRLVIYNPNGEDVSCGYGAPGSASWHTFYITKGPGVSEQDYFNGAVNVAVTQSGRAGDVASPLAGGPTAPRRQGYWKDSAGAVQGVTVSKLGDWLMKTRTTYLAGGERETDEVISTLYRQAAILAPGP